MPEINCEGCKYYYYDKNVNFQGCKLEYGLCIKLEEDKQC